MESKLSAVEGKVKILLNKLRRTSKLTSEIQTEHAEKAAIASELASLRKPSSKAAELEQEIETKISIIECLERTVPDQKSARLNRTLTK